MSTVIIREGSLVSKDPADVKVYTVDWDAESLGVGVSAITSTWTITPVRPSTTDAALTKDTEVRLTGVQATAAFTALGIPRTVTVDNRVTQVRLIGGTLGQVYEVANKIRTSETPYQDKERSFRVLIENK